MNIISQSKVNGEDVCITHDVDNSKIIYAECAGGRDDQKWISINGAYQSFVNTGICLSESSSQPGEIVPSSCDESLSQQYTVTDDGFIENREDGDLIVVHGCDDLSGLNAKILLESELR